MKSRLESISLTAFAAALTISFSGCSKKSEPASPPPAPPPAPTASVDPIHTVTAAAQAKIDAAKKEAEALKAQAEASAKAEAAALQALADQKAAEAQRAANDLKAQATSAKNSLLSSASALKTDATANTASTAPASTSSTSSLQSLAQNLNPSNFSAWYEKASAESSGIITSLASKAAELGSQASPQFKSLYETALSQKKTFDEVSSQIKAGGLTQWAQLYPKLQTSWTDLSKSLTDAKALLAQYSK